MDRLRSPGGCPWDAQQTHESLVPYALEEAHELAEAIETGDRAGLREELGDLLLQVVFHARIATEHPSDPFDVDDVAADLVAKLVRRHPHVFEDAAGRGRRARAVGPAEERGEAARVGARRVPLALGALARAQKIAGRAGRAGLAAHVARRATAWGSGCSRSSWRRRPPGVDAEGALRRTAAAWEQDLRAAGARRRCLMRRSADSSEGGRKALAGGRSNPVACPCPP